MVCSEYGLDVDKQKWVLLMNCYSVHMAVGAIVEATATGTSMWRRRLCLGRLQGRVLLFNARQRPCDLGFACGMRQCARAVVLIWPE